MGNLGLTPGINSGGGIIIIIFFYLLLFFLRTSLITCGSKVYSRRATGQELKREMLA